MKKSMIALTLLAAVGFAPAHAEQAQTTHQRCSVISELAEVIMNARQAGVPMRTTMELAGEDKASQAMVSQAYSQPLWSSEEYKIRAATEHANKWYLACIRADQDREQ